MTITLETESPEAPAEPDQVDPPETEEDPPQGDRPPTPEGPEPSEAPEVPADQPGVEQGATDGVED